MGISRDSRHKHRATGGRMPNTVKKRKYEMGRAPAMTKLGARRVRPVRCRGGNMKYRALRLDTGSFSWGSENISRPARIMQVVYNASNNELVRTNTLVKNTIVTIDATHFRQWYLTHYGVDLSRKKPTKAGAAGTAGTPAEAPEASGATVSKRMAAKHKEREASRQLDSAIEEQFASGRLLACISSRPGQIGRADGYVLEGAELHFYKRKLEKKKSSK